MKIQDISRIGVNIDFYASLSLEAMVYEYFRTSYDIEKASELTDKYFDLLHKEVGNNGGYFKE